MLKLSPRSLATADHGRVLQVVSNLVENAVRCTPSPGLVTISTAPGMVSVADTGSGLTSDDLPRAFERFYLYSRYGHDRPVGTGLGLAIVKELTEAMDGRVRVSSAVGVGTAFFVELPLAEEVPAVLAEPAASVEQAASAEREVSVAPEVSVEPPVRAVTAAFAEPATASDPMEPVPDASDPVDDGE